MRNHPIGSVGLGDTFVAVAVREYLTPAGSQYRPYCTEHGTLDGFTPFMGPAHLVASAHYAGHRR